MSNSRRSVESEEGHGANGQRNRPPLKPEEGVEDQILQRLAEIGLVVPTRDPNRPKTKTEQRCGTRGAVGVSREGGSSFHYHPRCKSWGCSHGAKERADREMRRVCESYPAFVGVDEVCSGYPAYATNADKIPRDVLWVTSVPTPPESPRTVKERVNKRVGRLVLGGVSVECVLVPCDGATIIVSTADLAEEKVRGRKQLAPALGWWCPTGVALPFLKATLASTAVNGRVWWSKGWRVGRQPKRAYVVSGAELVTKTAYRILKSETYEFTGSFWEADPNSVLLDATRRAENFWADPQCTACATGITPDSDHWWRDGQPLCGTCDLAVELLDLMTRGRTEREIEAHCTFRRFRTLSPEFSDTGRRPRSGRRWGSVIP